MALKFLSSAEVGDAELIINLDLDGLQTLLKTLTAALEARLDEGRPASEAAAGGDKAHAFAGVTIRFADSVGSETRPEISQAGGARGSGATACWEMPRI